MLNKRMLTMEDANSILCHFGKGFCDYYTLDTKLLTTADTWFAYDFIDVYRVTGSISFNVKNSLWTGGFRVIDSNIGSPSVSVSGDSIVVTGTGLEWVILILELSPEFNYGEIFELDYQVEYTPVIRPFYEDIVLTMGFLDGDEPVTGMSVTDKITGETLTTDSDGLVTVTAPLDKAGDYDYVLEAENNGETVEYRFPYQRLHSELPVALLNSQVYRDKVNILEFQFLYDDMYNITEDMLFGENTIRLKVNGHYYSLTDYTGSVFRFTVPVSLASYLNIRLEISGNDYLMDYVVDMNVSTVYLSVDDAQALNSELAGESPAGTILYTGAGLESSVNVSTDVNVLFRENVSSNLDEVFTVNDGAVLKLGDCNFTGKGLVTISDGTVEVVNGGFTHCTSTLFKGTGDLSIEDSSFVDNYSCIDLDGDVSLTNTLFDLSDESYLDTGSPAFVRCYQGLSVDYCQFNLDLHGLTSLGLSYVMFYLGKAGVVNTVKVKDLDTGKFPTGHNRGDVDVESSRYHFTGIGGKCMIWTVQDTNSVYSNNLNVEYIGEDEED